MDSGIYSITNILNGKRYIGSSCQLRRRWKNHRSALRSGRHSNKHLQRAWDKDGEESFQFSIIEYVFPGMLLDVEQMHLDRCSGEYNIATVADAPSKGRKHTEEERAKISQANCTRALAGRYPFGPERSVASEAVSEATRAKLSAAAIGENNPFYGRRHTEKSKAAISEKARGRQVSEATRAKLSAAGVGRKHSEATRARMRAARAMQIRLPEIGKKIGDALRGRKLSGEMREKLSIAQKRRWALARQEAN